MNNLKISVKGGTTKFHPVVTVDGKSVKTKKNQYGSVVGSVSTEKSQVELAVYRVLEISSPIWFLMAMLFFIVSCFGILNPRYPKNCVVLDARFKIDMKENSEVNISLNNIVDGKKGVEIQTENTYEEISNIYYEDKKAKKRLKVWLAIRIVLWIALAAGIIAWIVLAR